MMILCNVGGGGAAVFDFSERRGAGTLEDSSNLTCMYLNSRLYSKRLKRMN